jgi:hypothetical protein
MNKCLLAITFLISGCAPLQQAPLVYTSKQVLGIDISAPTTESTGVTFNLGFKNVDAAYVPVAVSKKEGSADDTKLKEIYATYGRGHQNSAEDQRRQAEQKMKIEQLTRTLESRDEAIAKLKTLDAQVESYNKSVETLSSAPKAQVSSIKKALTDDIVELKSTQILPQTIQEKLDKKEPLSSNEVEVAVEPLKEKITRLDDKVDEDRRALEKTFDISQRDAMSVFGSFASNVDNGQSTGLSQNLGKMFSTGVAAQNLTQGIHTRGVIEQCIALVNLAKDETQKKSVIDMCINQASNSDSLKTAASN